MELARPPKSDKARTKDRSVAEVAVQRLVGTCLPTLMMLPKLIGVKLTVAYLAFWLVYSVGSGILVGWIL